MSIIFKKNKLKVKGSNGEYRDLNIIAEEKTSEKIKQLNDAKDELLEEIANNPILDNKVDKVSGKGLSTYDFNKIYKSTLDEMPFGYSYMRNYNPETGEFEKSDRLIATVHVDSVTGDEYTTPTTYDAIANVLSKKIEDLAKNGVFKNKTDLDTHIELDHDFIPMSNLCDVYTDPDFDDGTTGSDHALSSQGAHRMWNAIYNQFILKNDADDKFIPKEDKNKFLLKTGDTMTGNLKTKNVTVPNGYKLSIGESVNGEVSGSLDYDTTNKLLRISSQDIQFSSSSPVNVLNGISIGSGEDRISINSDAIRMIGYNLYKDGIDMGYYKITDSGIESDYPIDVDRGIAIKDGNTGNKAYITHNGFTKIRDIRFPDKDGTIALTSDIPTTASDIGADEEGSASSALEAAKDYSNANLASAKVYTDTKVANLIGSAPETMDTLQEVAAAIEEHKDVTDALNSAIGNKVDKVRGKGLSTYDFKTKYKETIDSMPTSYSLNTGYNSEKGIFEMTSTEVNAKTSYQDPVTGVTEEYTLPINYKKLFNKLDEKIADLATNGVFKNKTNLDSHINGGTNPHGTTKSDVGLENVPNVTTNDQTPSYTEATTLVKLTNGEKLSIAFGKISRAITDLISHIGDSVKHITSTERTNWNSAKTHADSAHARTDATKVEASTTNGNIKINGTETNVYTHPSGTNPHGTTKSDVGLGNVDNTSDADKPISTAQQAEFDSLKSDLVTHDTDSVKHITRTERTNWNAAKSHADSAHAPSNAQQNVQSDWNATSGDAFIKNKPSIPSESTVSGWGFTKNTGTYSKPSGGIPKSDLASAVQTSLGKADTALQSHQDISGKLNKSGGTMTGDLTISNGSALNIGTSVNGEVSGSLEYDTTNKLLRISSQDIQFSSSSPVNVLNGIRIGSGKQTSITSTTLTDNRYLSLPDKSGTIALTSDLDSYLPLSGGTMTGDLTLEDDKIIKIGTIEVSSNGINTTQSQQLINIQNGISLVQAGTNIKGTIYPYKLSSNRYIALPDKDGTIALTSDIPTNNNQLTNGAGYITSSGTAKTISDTLPISKGGTGKTTGADAFNELVNSVSTGDSTPQDSDYYISQYVGGGTTTTTYHRRPMSSLWNYIKSKLATVATSGSYNDLSNKPTIPSVGNGTVTIKQAGTSKGTFTMNQSGNTTIELTDNNTTYGVATSSSLGLVKSGTDITVDSSGNVSVNDDSHNHVISNVDGLQGALDGKASASHTHSKSEILDFPNVLVAQQGGVNITIDDLYNKLKGTPGGTGSVSISKKSSGIGSDIPSSWFNYLYMPHRNGISEDSPNYASILLTPMSHSGASFIVRFASGSIKECKIISTGEHTHDDRYYTESEVDSKLDNKFSGTYKKVESGNTSSYPWHRIAYTLPITGSFVDADAIIAIKNNYDGGKFGILKISIRTNGAGSGSCSAEWIIRKGYATTDVQIGYHGVFGNTYADVYLKCSTYARTTVSVLSGFGWSWWNICDSTEGNNGVQGENVYASIADGGTDIRGEEYTTTVVSKDTSTVHQANEVAVFANNPTSTKSYYVPFHGESNSGFSGMSHNNGLMYWTKEGTTSSVGSSELAIGNSVGEGNSGNKKGCLSMSNAAGKWTSLYSGSNTSNIEVTLPSKTGTIALAEDVISTTGGEIKNWYTDGILFPLVLHQTGNASHTNFGNGIKFINASDSDDTKWSGIAGYATSSYANQNGLRFYTNATNYISISSNTLIPTTNNGANIGTSSLKWANIHATTFHEDGKSLSSKYASYDSATWEPKVGYTGSSNYSFTNGKYTKIGNVVHCSLEITMTGTATEYIYVSTSSLPFSISGGVFMGGQIYNPTGGSIVSLIVVAPITSFQSSSTISISPNAPTHYITFTYKIA